MVAIGVLVALVGLVSFVWLTAFDPPGPGRNLSVLEVPENADLSSHDVYDLNRTEVAVQAPVLADALEEANRTGFVIIRDENVIQEICRYLARSTGASGCFAWIAYEGSRYLVTVGES